MGGQPLVSAEMEPLHPRAPEHVCPDVLLPSPMGDTEPSPGAHLGATLMRGKDRALKGGHKEEERALG